MPTPLQSLSEKKQSNFDKLTKAYQDHGSNLLISLYCLPELNDIASEYLLKRDDSSDLTQAHDFSFWRKFSEADKKDFLEAMANHLGTLKEEESNFLFNQLTLWQQLNSQIELLEGLLPETPTECMLRIYFNDPLLTSAFDSLIAGRNLNFPRELIPFSMSSTEMLTFNKLLLVPRLLNSTKQQRSACLERLFHQANLQLQESESPISNQE